MDIEEVLEMPFLLFNATLLYTINLLQKQIIYVLIIIKKYICYTTFFHP